MTNNPVSLTQSFAKRVKNAVERSEIDEEPSPPENKAKILADYTSPVEIVSAWTSDVGVWKCRARRLRKIDGIYQTIDNGVEFDLSYPTSVDNPTLEIGARVFAIYRGSWEVVSGVACDNGDNSSMATVILPICRAFNPQAKGDWIIPFNKVYQTEHNSRTHFAAQTGFVAIDGKSYTPLIASTVQGVTRYYKNLRVSRDVSPSLTVNANAHYNVISDDRTEILQRPIIVYDEPNGNEWKPWEDNFQWETTTDINKAWLDYDIAACPTLDYSEVLVLGERVKVLRTETHHYYRKENNTLTPESTTVTVVEPSQTYSVEFEGTAEVNEFGIWHKERKLTNNQHDVLHTTIDANFNIGTGTAPYDYWGFDTVDLHPNGLASWNFIKIAALPKLEKIQNPGQSNDIDDSHVSRPILTDTVNISNTACNTRAYGLWYKTDRDGVRYPILCNVESLTYGTCIETRKKNCYVLNADGDCAEAWKVFKFTIEREGNRLVLPTIYCAVTCAGASSGTSFPGGFRPMTDQEVDDLFDSNP